MLPPIFLCLSLSFPESEISARVSGKTPKNLRLHRWLALFCPRLSPLSLLLLPNPCFRRILYPFSFSFRPGFRPSVPFPFSPGCECHLTHWSPEPGQCVVPPFLRWFHTASLYQGCPIDGGGRLNSSAPVRSRPSSA